MPSPQTIEEIQSAIAARVTDLPPNVQADILQVIDFAFLAGYQSCKRDIAAASQALMAARLRPN